MSGDLGGTNAIETMRRAWIIELDEMDAVKRTKEFSTVKAFITRPADHYVPKWIRESVEVKRSSVLGGTVNDREFLADEDGLRRFWVIPLGKRIDVEWVRTHRDELFSEAVALYRAKQPWHLEPELEQLRRQANEQFTLQHPWQQLVEDYLGDKAFLDFITMQELYGKALFVSPPQQTGGTDKVVGSILRKLGWYRGVSGPERARVRGWKRVLRES
jgi:predicted P-loop ATPase